MDHNRLQALWSIDYVSVFLGRAIDYVSCYYLSVTNLVQITGHHR